METSELAQRRRLATERARRYRARQRGEDVPKERAGAKPWQSLRFCKPPQGTKVLVLLRSGDIHVASLEWHDDEYCSGWVWEGLTGDDGYLNDLGDPVEYWRPLPHLPAGFKARPKPEWKPKPPPARLAR